MPVNPHPIEITVNDTDNATAKAGVKVYLRNVTKKSDSHVMGDEPVTNSSGIVTIDLANMPLIAPNTVEYAAGDKILIIAFDGDNHDAAMYTVEGTDEAQTLNLNPVKHERDLAGGEVFKYINLANTSGTVAYAKFYTMKTGRLIMHGECPANDNRALPVSGLGADGGFVIERESSGLVVCVTLK